MSKDKFQKNSNEIAEGVKTATLAIQTKDIVEIAKIIDSVNPKKN